MNQFLMEKCNLKVASLPVDMNTVAITGARVNVAKGDRVAFIQVMGTSTAAVVEFTLRQHNAASSGTSKDLSVDNPYYVKAAAATSFTKVQPGSATALYALSTTFAADSGIVVFEILGDQLDVDGGFSYVSVDVADSTAAKLLSSLYLMHDCRFNPAYSEII